MTKKTPYIAAAGALLGVFFFAVGTAQAQIVQNSDQSTIVQTASDTNVTFYMGTTTAMMILQSITIAAANPDGNSTYLRLRLTCLANTFSSSQAGCLDTAPILAINEYTAMPAEKQLYQFNFAAGSGLQSGKVYIMEIISAGGSTIEIYGSPTVQFTDQCVFWTTRPASDCTGTPYWVMNSTIDWGAIQFPYIYASTSQAIAASSSLWGSIALASSTPQCATDNFFAHALCSAGVFLFVPNTALVDSFTQLASTTLPSKFPFSWYYGIKNTFTALTASSSANMAVLNIDFSSVDPATSTPMGGILPNAVLLSSTTISTYLSPSLLALILGLETAAIWAIFALYIFHDVQRNWLHH